MKKVKCCRRDGKEPTGFDYSRMEIKKWCQSLGKFKQDWFPLLTLYNTGRNLFGTSNLSPTSFVGEMTTWTWIRYNESNPFYGCLSSEKVINGIAISSFGHNNNSDVGVGITFDQIYYSVINSGWMLHMVDTISGPEFCLQYRPLPMVLFNKAFQSF